MTLMDQIKADQVSARKQKMTAVASLLTTLIGEAEMVGKNAGNRAPTDAEVQAVIKKFIKNLDETIAVLGDADPRTLAALGEKSTLEIVVVYIPMVIITLELIKLRSHKDSLQSVFSFLYHKCH